MTNSIIKHNTDLEIRRNSVVDMVNYLPQMRELAKVFRTAAIVNSQLTTDEQVLAVMFKAIELNLPMTTALEKMSVINKNVMMEAELILALIYRSGVCVKVEFPKGTESVCTVVMERINPKVKHTSTFTLEQAKRAGLTDRSDAWRKYPEKMLRWRAITDCARVVFADVLGGMLDNVPLMVKIPQPDYASEPSVPDEVQVSNEAVQEATYEHIPEPTSEPAPAPEPVRPYPPETVRERVVAIAARVNGDGDVILWRKRTADLLKLVTIRYTEIGALLRYFFGKSTTGELSTKECKAVCKWLNVTENGDMSLADINSVSEFHLIMKERMPQEAHDTSGASSAEAALFGGDDEDEGEE